MKAQSFVGWDGWNRLWGKALWGRETGGSLGLDGQPAWPAGREPGQ